MTLGHKTKWLCCSVALAALTGEAVFSQSRTDTFVIDPEKPFVFISFDHVALPSSPPGNDGSNLLWLRIRNNSRVPIQVRTIAPEEGAEGVEVMHEIVEASKAAGYASGSVRVPSGWISPPDHYLPIDVFSTANIEPGTDLPFSIPLNHVGPSWYLRTTFQFVLPRVRAGRQPSGLVDFTWADIPATEQRAWKSDARK
jgi:hypothetical protein